MSSPQNLSPCQENALNQLSAGSGNFFVTGRAGTGKSYLVRQFLKGRDRKTFPVVASTGAAAVLVGGRTFHSFFGLGIMEGGVEKTVERALGEKRVLSRLKKIEGFVLDEVSMIPGSALRAAEEICRSARKNKAPWGGARVIAVGDFAQLPPINPHSQEKEWAFLEPAWRKSMLKPLILKTVLRTEDAAFVNVLNSIRDGLVTDEVRLYLERKIDLDEELTGSTRLFPLRNTAESFNRQRLTEIKKPLKEFPTKYTGDARAIETLKKQAPIPEVLHLKETALVMIRVNEPNFAYANGSLGVIVKIAEDCLTIRLKNGKEVDLEPATFSLLNADGNAIATATNFPVTLAYATTIHKAQGATLDAMVCDLRNLWEPGQAYVALSRLKSGGGLSLLGWDEGSIRVDPQVAEFHRSFEEGTPWIF